MCVCMCTCHLRSRKRRCMQIYRLIGTPLVQALQTAKQRIRYLHTDTSIYTIRLRVPIIRTHGHTPTPAGTMTMTEPRDGRCPWDVSWSVAAVHRCEGYSKLLRSTLVRPVLACPPDACGRRLCTGELISLAGCVGGVGRRAEGHAWGRGGRGRRVLARAAPQWLRVGAPRLVLAGAAAVSVRLQCRRGRGGTSEECAPCGLRAVLGPGGSGAPEDAVPEGGRRRRAEGVARKAVALPRPAKKRGRGRGAAGGAACPEESAQRWRVCALFFLLIFVAAAG